MIVVSNTSPITNLAAVGKLLILQQLYSSIVIPGAVFRELTEVEYPVPGTEEVQTCDWIITQQVANPALVTSLKQELDAGEAEAIALALELKADLLLLDERRGYQAASSLGLKVQGLLGVLLAAKSRGWIPTVKPVMDDLIGRAGFWVSQALYSRILELAGESSADLT
ncbi:MAG: DUF3368 domain-containing protein [Symploca sp. SIO1B1]|nr:DUF3368 domain-containing protein [Symploca sp. SIO1B1]